MKQDNSTKPLTKRGYMNKYTNLANQFEQLQARYINSALRGLKPGEKFTLTVPASTRKYKGKLVETDQVMYKAKLINVETVTKEGFIWLRIQNLKRRDHVESSIMFDPSKDTLVKL